MIKLLARLFIKDSENVTDMTVRRKYGTLCGLYGIFLNILLFAGKYFAGIISGSVAITADAFNNLSDAGSSVITLLGFALAGKKPDADHPFGHGRVEYLTGMVLSVVIIVTGFELGKTSVEKIISPEAIQVGLLPGIILVASILVKVYMFCYNRMVGKKISSEVMQATATDSLSDSIATAVVLLSMLATYFFKINIDGYAGLIVAAFIVFAGYSAAKDTLSPLLGPAPDPVLVRGIENTVLAHPEVVGIHDMMIHDYGPGRLMVSLHAEVDGNGNLFHLHDAIDLAEREIRENYGCVATIHMDPIESKDTVISETRAAVAEKLTVINPQLTIHDFRMVPGPTHTNLIFDAAVPADFHMKDSEIAEKIQAIVHEHWDNYYAVVSIDRSYL